MPKALNLHKPRLEIPKKKPQDHVHQSRSKSQTQTHKFEKGHEPKKKNGELSPPRLYLLSRSPTRPLSIPNHQDL